MIELRWVYKDVPNSPNRGTRTKVLEFMRTHKVVENIIERDERGNGIVIQGYVLHIIQNPEWEEVPLLMEAGTFVIA